RRRQGQSPRPLVHPLLEDQRRTQLQARLALVILNQAQRETEVLTVAVGAQAQMFFIAQAIQQLTEPFAQRQLRRSTRASRMRWLGENLLDEVQLVLSQQRVALHCFFSTARGLTLVTAVPDD